MEEWRIYRLPEIAKFSQGKQVPIEFQNEIQKDNMVRFIRIVDFTSGWTQAPRYIENDEKYCVDEDDIIMIRYGTPGRVFRGHRGIIANNLFKIDVNEDIITKDFAYWFLCQDSICQQLMSMQASTTMPAISFGMLKNVSIQIPSIKCQKIITRILDSIQNKIELNYRINHNLPS